MPKKRQKMAMNDEMRAANLSEILFEFHQIGSYVKVMAMDPKTGVEVTTIGSTKYSEEMLKATAARKLAYVLNNKKGMAAPGKGGILA